MFISKTILLIVSLFCISCRAQEILTQVNLTLYTEGLCPTCKQFIVTQLYPAAQVLGDSLVVEMVPFGAMGKFGDEWTCNHGPLECYLNSVDSCLINLKPSQIQLLSFASCHGKKTSIHKSQEETEAIVKECAEENNVSWDDINKCLTDGTVETLLLANQEKTENAGADAYPDIRFFNSFFNNDLELSSLQDLVATVCNFFTSFKGAKPSACDEEFLNVKN
ncbi:unnamed protein product [Psylliodes chrysocephalus]|uniref:Gamma-interferon-inducible lysosomal thiol reductase n=1 Tax=Psylliodes chrysocephalus TaxID=3402493 RepID=A0A9P0CLC5_9CUCU|nr:unnamed protein product [Psylliodes chrysocephala]